LPAASHLLADYERPSLTEALARSRAFARRLAAALDADEAIALVQGWNRLRSSVYTQRPRAQVAHYQNTARARVRHNSGSTDLLARRNGQGARSFRLRSPRLHVARAHWLRPRTGCGVPGGNTGQPRTAVPAVLRAVCRSPRRRSPPSPRRVRHGCRREPEAPRLFARDSRNRTPGVRRAAS
jgi:hypothetical protein